MIERMDECGPPISVEDVENLEAHIGIRLPDDYRAFLLKHNGGRPTPDTYPIEGLANNPFGGVHFFFGIDDPVESCNLDWNFRIMNGRLPSNLFAIAGDAGMDLICLSLFGDDAGSVVFWDGYHEPSEPSYANVYRIAESFPAFLESLRPLEHFMEQFVEQFPEYKQHWEEIAETRRRNAELEEES